MSSLGLGANPEGWSESEVFVLQLSIGAWNSKRHTKKPVPIARPAYSGAWHLLAIAFIFWNSLFELTFGLRRERALDMLSNQDDARNRECSFLKRRMNEAHFV